MFKCEKGQVSVELLIIMAVVVGIAALLVTQLGNTSSTSAQKINNKSADLFRKIDGLDSVNSTPVDGTQ